MEGSAPALTIFAFVGVLFLGGVLRCRAPLSHNDGTQGPKFSEFTVSQQQCSLRGHCSAEATESGIDGTAGNTAEFKRRLLVIRWSPKGNEAPRCGGSSICEYCLGHGDEEERARERLLCQGDCVEQFGERPLCQNVGQFEWRPFCEGDCSGQLVENQEKQKRLL